MQVKDVMTSPVISVEPDASIWQAVRIMLQRRISGLPVIDKHGRLVGMVSEGDFLRRAETGTQRRRPNWLEFLMGPGRLADEYTRSHGRKIQDIMTPDPVTVTEATSLDEVVRTMEKRRIKRLPVVRGKEVVGIVSRANLIHALAGIARELVPTTATDEAIRASAIDRPGKGAVGARRPHRRHRAQWRGRTVGHDYRRTPAAGTDRGRGKRARRESRPRSSLLGRRDVRPADVSTG
jgi:CBS domain-containing protein